jgi:lariat debranching enzyme
VKTKTRVIYQFGIQIQALELIRMKIAIEGCAHGELERIYDIITETEKHQGIKVDLLICCGDFQSTRNMDDLECMAVPNKFKDMCSFYK